MNRWREVLCTTPMRLTLRLVVLFVAISLVAFGATWWLANNALIDATEGGQVELTLWVADAAGDRAHIGTVFHGRSE